MFCMCSWSSFAYKLAHLRAKTWRSRSSISSDYSFRGVNVTEETSQTFELTNFENGVDLYFRMYPNNRVKNSKRLHLKAVTD